MSFVLKSKDRFVLKSKDRFVLKESPTEDGTYTNHKISAPKTFIEKASAPVKRIPEIYKKEVDESLEQLKSKGFVNKALGSLRYISAPITAPVEAIVGEPTEQAAKNLGASENVATFARGMAEGAAYFASPSKAVTSRMAKAPKLYKPTPKSVKSNFLEKEFKERFISKAKPETIRKLEIAEKQTVHLKGLKDSGKPLIIKGAKEPVQVTDSMVRRASDVVDNIKYEMLPKGVQSKLKAPKYKPVIKEKAWTPKTNQFDKQVLPGVAKSQKMYSGLPIPEITKVYRGATNKIWDIGIEKKIPQLLEKIPGGKAVNRALIYDYRGELKNTGKFIRSLEDKNRAQQVGRSYAIDLGKRLQEMPEKSQLALGEYIKGNTKKLSPELMAIGDESKMAMLDLGKQAVDAGILAESTFFKNAGRYMPRLYTSKEYQGLLTKFNFKKPERLDLARFKKRKDIPAEIRKEMGEILTPGYPVAKGIAQLTHDIEQARWFSNIAKNKDWSSIKGGVAPNGWKKLPKEAKLGNLSEATVHPEIFKDLQNSIKVMEAPEKFGRKALGMWKFGKVVASPKTHVRNLMSNSILAHLGGMPLYEQPIYLTRAIKNMKSKGKYWQEASKEGLLGTTWTENELSSLFNNIDSSLKGVKAGSYTEKIGAVGLGIEKSKTAMNKAAKLYQAEEELFKLGKYIHNIERKKMSPKLAAADAEKWLFNYGKVTKAQEAYRSKWYGAPFATFTLKALPRIAEAAVKTPHRFVLPGAVIYGLEKAAMEMIGDTKEQFKAKKELRPDWMQGSLAGIPNFARVPVVDDSGREYYLNLSYILPWGDIGEAGGFAGIPGSLMPMSQPFTKEAFQQIANYDTFWESPIVKEEDVAGKTGIDKTTTIAKKRGAHAFQTAAPTPVIDVIKGVEAMRGKPDYRGRFRPVAAVAADTFLGIKTYPVDYMEQLSRKIRKTHPTKGTMGQKIVSQMRTLEIKRRAVEKKGGNTDYYKKQIEIKKKQLEGLAKEAIKLGKTAKKLNKEN